MNSLSLIFLVFFTSTPAELVAANRTGFTLEVSIPEISESEKNIEGKFFSSLFFDGCSYTSQIGKPKIPVVTKLVELPYDAEINTIIKDFTVKECGVKYPVLPVQPPVPKIRGARVEFRIDKEFYLKDTYYPEEIVKVVEIGIIRGHRIGLLEIFPVRYNPSKGKFEFYQKMRIEVEYKNSDFTKTVQNINKYYSPPFERSLRRVLFNYGVFEKGLKLQTMNYLIITADDYFVYLDSLVEWKEALGYDVRVAITSEIVSDTTSITNYIKNEYNGPTPPTFVLLVGDVDDIPCYQRGSIATDLYFVTVDGDDYLPDIGIGRFAVKGNAQLNRIIEKTITYEKSSIGKLYFIASDASDGHTIAEGTHNYCIGLAREYGMVCDSLFGWDDYGGTPIPDAVNDGRSMVIYSGHGGVYRWVGPPFTQLDIRGLSNLKYPVVFSFACHTGKFTYAECFGETWIRERDRGAVAFWGSSTTSYWDEDDILQRGMFDAMFFDGKWGIFEAFNEGRLRLKGSGIDTSYVHDYFEQYNLLGDPSLSFVIDKIVSENYWLDDDTIGMSHGNGDGNLNPLETVELEITLKNYSTNPKDSVIGILHTDDPYVTISDSITNFGYIDSFASVYCDIPFVFTVVDTPDNNSKLGFELVLKDANDSVWISRFNIVCGFPEVIYYSCSVDSLINPGDTVDLKILLKNVGPFIAKDVSAVLRTDDENITVVDSLQSYESIEPNSVSSTVIDALTVAVGTQVAPGTKVQFFLDVSLKGNFHNTESFKLLIGRGGDFLVWDPDSNHSSGPIIKEILDANGYYGFYTDSLGEYYDVLPYFKSIFVCLGVYNQNYVIDATSADAESLISYIVNHNGNLYIEGGDVWFYDPGGKGFDFGPFFHINPISDGPVSGNLFTVTGENGAFTNGMEFNYVGEDSSIDIIESIDNAFEIFSSQNNENECIGIAYDGKDYRTIALSFELGGLVNGDFTKEVLLDSIMHFFTKERRIPPEPPMLFQNFPNPFSSSTTLRYQIPSAGTYHPIPITLKIYNVAGQLIKTLVDGPQYPGYYSVTWDGKGNNGGKAASGVYFFRLTVENSSRTTKTVLIR